MDTAILKSTVNTVPTTSCGVSLLLAEAPKVSIHRCYYRALSCTKVISEHNGMLHHSVPNQTVKFLNLPKMTIAMAFIAMTVYT